MQQFAPITSTFQFLYSSPHSVPEPTPSTMTALHQFGAEMLKLSKRLESYPCAAAAAPAKQPLPPSPLLLPSSSYSIQSSTHRLIRSTTNASIANQRANNRNEVGDDTRAHYNTRAGGDDDTNVDYPKPSKRSPREQQHGRQQQQQQPQLQSATTAVSVEQRRYISRTCKPQQQQQQQCHQEPSQDQKLFLTCPPISSIQPSAEVG